ncbi:Transposase-associated domain [Sesbania bispinosa]|nr:Transposase-associated domain [Sesbania bispinosa]
MDKSWMLEPRSSRGYKDGLKQFLDFAFHNAAQGDQILCPCKNCNNCLWGNREEVYDHLICDGFDSGYKKWIYHGEGGSSKLNYGTKGKKFNMHHSVDELLEDTFMMPTQFEDSEFDDILGEDSEEVDAETTKFYKLVRDAHQEVYPGCKNFTKLSIIVRLLHIKNIHGWSNVSFNMLLQLMKELFMG